MQRISLFVMCLLVSGTAFLGGGCTASSTQALPEVWADSLSATQSAIMYQASECRVLLEEAQKKWEMRHNALRGEPERVLARTTKKYWDQDSIYALDQSHGVEYQLLLQEAQSLYQRIAADTMRSEKLLQRFEEERPGRFVGKAQHWVRRLSTHQRSLNALDRDLGNLNLASMALYQAIFVFED